MPRPNRARPPRFDARDRQRLADLRAALSVTRVEPVDMGRVLAPLRELIAAESTVAYRPVLEERLRVDFIEFNGKVPAPEALAFTVRFIEQSSQPVALYNPARVEPSQRNVAFRIREHVPDEQYFEIPLAKHCYPRLGLHGAHELRVLACDGPVLLSWIGGYRRERFGEREERLLGALVPSLRRWMQWHLRFARMATAAAALPAALEAIATPAFVLDGAGRPMLANQAGRALLGRDRRAMAGELARCARERQSNERFAVTPIAARGVPPAVLAVARARDGELEPRLQRARLVWRLTRRQLEVLRLLAKGHANRTMAEWLGCTERTIEVHVSNLLQMAGADSRAALVAKFWSEI